MLPNHGNLLFTIHAYSIVFCRLYCCL